MASLTITTGSEGGRRVDCDREVVIGRGDADIVVADDQMSRRHAVVRPVAGGVEVEDLDSLNGTFVNEEQISGKVTLTENATVRIGVTEFALEIPVDDGPAIPAGATRISASPPSDATVVRKGPPITAGMSPPPGVGAGPPPGVGGPPPGVGAPGGGPPPWVQAGGGPPGGGPPGGGPPGGGPPKIVRILHKSFVGRPLLRLMMKRKQRKLGD